MIIWSVIADILSLSSFATINIPIYIFKYLTLDSPCIYYQNMQNAKIVIVSCIALSMPKQLN